MGEVAIVLDPLMSAARADAVVRLCEDFGTYRLHGRTALEVRP